MLKLVQSSIKGLNTDSTNELIVRTIPALAESLHAIAEGIESADQRDRLKTCGSETGQGFLFLEPLTIYDWRILSKILRLNLFCNFIPFLPQNRPAVSSHYPKKQCVL